MKRGLFDVDFRLEELSKLGDPLEKLRSYIDFESFRGLLEGDLKDYDKRKGGRPPFDRVMLFKGLVLKSTYNLSFDKLEYHIKDRLSFQRFLGLSIGDRVPDANTFWLFNEYLVKAEKAEDIFFQLNNQLQSRGLLLNKGSLIDASIVDAPIQRNTREENKQIKEGKTALKSWSKNKRRQKDTDASWVKKNNVNRFGYKNHIKVDKGSKLITKCCVSPSNIHDSQALGDLLTANDSHHQLYADSAYRSQKIEKQLKKMKIQSRIHKKGHRNEALSDKDKRINRNKSKARARVEHIFGDMRQKMGQILVRQIGIARNTLAIYLMNISYNMRRSSYLLAKSGA